jgi:hypothetical protein
MLVLRTQKAAQAVKNDTETGWDDQYLRMALTFDTTSERYAWLTASLFVARGRLRGAKSLEYQVFRLT